MIPIHQELKGMLSNSTLTSVNYNGDLKDPEFVNSLYTYMQFCTSFPYIANRYHLNGTKLGILRVLLENRGEIFTIGDIAKMLKYARNPVTLAMQKLFELHLVDKVMDKGADKRTVAHYRISSIFDIENKHSPNTAQ